MHKISMMLGVLAAPALILASACTSEETATRVQSSSSTTKGSTPKPVAIKLVAKRAQAEKSILSEGKPLSCVRVTVTNQTKKKLEVNPLYFSITDTGNNKHDASSALGEYEGQIDTTTLAPREKVTGMVCARGKFKPKIISMTDPLLSEKARAEVL